MKKVLSADGLGEKVFGESHAAALLNLPGTKWQFIRNHDPEREPNPEPSAKAEPSEQDGGSSDAAGTGTASREGVGPRKRERNYQSSAAFTDLVDWMKLQLPRDKARTAMNLVRHPLDTVALVGEMYQEMERAFDGVDRNEVVQFVDDTLGEDWDEYKQQHLGGEDAWRSKGIDTLRCRPNGILIADLEANPNPADQRPAPYWYVLDLEKAHSYSVLSDNVLDYLIYFGNTPKDVDYKLCYVFDELSYRVYEYYDSGANDSRLVLLTDNPHNLGHCPARMFWTDSVDSSAVVLKQHPISDYLGMLDWFQISTWFGRFGDLFNGWPITTTFDQKCNFTNESEYCDDGYLRTHEALEGRANGVFLMSGESPVPCPVGKDRNSIGPGTNYSVPLPSMANGNNVLLPAVGITQVDVAAIKHQDEKLERMGTKIYSGVIGSMFEAMNKQAVNKDQVASLFEARKKAIIKVARNFEAAQQWVESCICRLRYGESFVSLEINYGTEYFLFSADELLELYTKAKTDTADAAVLDNLQWLFYQTKHRRQPRQLERAKITLALDPARHMNATTALPLLQAGVLTREEYALKLNMSSMISRFEREVGPLVSFQADKEWGVRINAIKAVLLSYIPKAPAVQAGDENNDNNPAPGNRANQT